MNELQKQHAQWLATEFPSQPVWLPAAGLVEEAGELLHCVLKRKQISMFGADSRYTDVDWEDKLTDAVGDCAIYAISLCNAAGWNFGALLECCYPVALDDGGSVKLAAKLVRAGTQVAVSAPDVLPAQLCKYLSYLRAVCKAENVDFEEAVWATWNTVKLRRKR